MATARRTPYAAMAAYAGAGQRQNSSVAISTSNAAPASPASNCSSSTTISFRETGRQVTVPGQGSSGLIAGRGVGAGGGGAAGRGAVAPPGVERGPVTPTSVCPRRAGPIRSGERLDLLQKAAHRQELAQMLPVVRAGQPCLTPLRGVQPGVVPAQCPGGRGAAASRRAEQRRLGRVGRRHGAPDRAVRRVTRAPPWSDRPGADRGRRTETERRGRTSAGS